MKRSFNSNISQSEFIQKQINDFKNMLGYLNQDEHLKNFIIDDFDSPLVQLIKTLSLGQEIQHRIDNPDESLYQQSLAAKVASEFGLQISPMYYGRGISLIDGKKFINFLSHISLQDLNDPGIKTGIKSILTHIKCLYGYILEKNLDNDKFDNFYELVHYWGDIEKQYERLGMQNHLKNFTMKPYVDAFNGGYLRSLLGLKKLLWRGDYDPFKMTTTQSFNDLHEHKNNIDDYVDQICKWGKKEIGHQESLPLVKHIFSLYMQTINNDKEFFNLSDDKVNYLLGKFKDVLSKL